MSQAELARFVATAQQTPSILDRYRTLATPADVAAQLRNDGYDVTDGELEVATRHGTELSDEQLDGVAGGTAGPRWVIVGDGSRVSIGWDHIP